MSSDAVVSRIDQIVAMQQQLFDPAPAVASTPAAASAAAGTVATDTGVPLAATLSPGQPIASIIPGSSTGIELGFAAGVGQSAYASRFGGGYSDGQRTAAGQAFSDLIASLGGPGGLAEGRPVVGHFP
jgi:hypothetical protein